MQVKQPFEIPHEGDELTRAARRNIDRTIQSLKARRNELSPISVLPPETLSKIFIFARDWSIDQAAWIVVGHVCHHWREVALGCPSLWSAPVFTRPDLAQEMIQRSKMAALAVRSAASTWTPNMLEHLENAITQIHRIQSIDLMLSETLNTTVFSSLSQPVPLLESISLWNAPVTHNQFSFPIGTLSYAPRLRSIGLDYFNFNWESAVFRHRSLTDLRLSNNHVATDGTSTIGQMMDALHHLPNLRTLVLNDSIPPHTTSYGNQEALEFKFLEHLELGANAADCIFLLCHIQYPPYATVILHSSSTALEDSITIFSLISQNLRHTQSVEAEAPPSPVIIRSMRLSTSPETAVTEINFSNKVNDTQHLRLPFGALITLCLSGSFSQARGSVLPNIIDYFDLSSLQGLALDWCCTYSQIHTIRNFFGKLPKLKIIKVSEPAFREICLAITETPKDSSVESPGEIQTLNPRRRRESQHSFPPATFFPALRTFAIEGVDFRPNPAFPEYLIDMFMKRSDMNAPIDRLSLEQCIGVPVRRKEQLGLLVVDLEIEGKVIDVRELDPNDDEDIEYDRDDEYGGGYSDDDYFIEP